MSCQLGVAPDPAYTELPLEAVPVIAWCFTHNCRADGDGCRDTRIAELEAALRTLATTPAVLQALGTEHTPECHCPLCRANLLLRRREATNQE